MYVTVSYPQQNCKRVVQSSAALMQSPFHLFPSGIGHRETKALFPITSNWDPYCAWVTKLSTHRLQCWKGHATFQPELYRDPQPGSEMVIQRDANAEEEMSTKEHSQNMTGSADPSVEAKVQTREERRGGWVTTPFIFGCEASERLAIFGALANLITFLTQEMHMRNLSAATLLNTLSSGSTGASLLGAFVADAYLGRFTTIAIGSWIMLSGMFTLTMIALNQTLHPAACSPEEYNDGACEKASSLQMGILYLSLALMATGSGGIRPTVSPFGASQFDQAHHEEKKQLKHYFNWYYFTVTLASLLATTILVYIQDDIGWALGFGVPAMVFLVSIMFFFGGMRLYRYTPPRGSPFTRMAQVIVAAVRKRKLELPDDPSRLYRGHKKEQPHLADKDSGKFDAKDGYNRKFKLEKNFDISVVENGFEVFDLKKEVIEVSAEINNRGVHLEKTSDAKGVGPHRVEEVENSVIVLHHSNQFRCLDRAAIEVAEDWSTIVQKEGHGPKNRLNPWKLCPVQQVEELKCIVRLAPMWATVIPLAVATSQGHTYLIQQARTMDRHIGKHFTIPAASMSTITMIIVLIWLPFYDKKVVPFLRRYTGKEKGITFIQKIGVGIALLILAEMVKALVEHKRRGAAAHYGLVDRPHETIPFSAFWLVPQFVIGGLSESFMMIGHLEFFYYMLPEHMTSTGSALSLAAYAIGSNLSTISLHVIQKVTQRQGHPGWLSNNINEAHLDYFYGLLTVLLALDFMFFLVVAYWYKRQMHLNQMMLQSS